MRVSTGTADIDRLYTGQRFDSVTGLYYYNARYYDPELARFISPDTIVPGVGDPQAWNRYAYVLGNPLRYVDPSGLYHRDDEIDGLSLELEMAQEDGLHQRMTRFDILLAATMRDSEFEHAQEAYCSPNCTLTQIPRLNEVSSLGSGSVILVSEAGIAITIEDQFPAGAPSFSDNVKSLFTGGRAEGITISSKGQGSGGVTVKEYPESIAAMNAVSQLLGNGTVQAYVPRAGEIRVASLSNLSVGLLSHESVHMGQRRSVGNARFNINYARNPDRYEWFGRRVGRVDSRWILSPQ